MAKAHALPLATATQQGSLSLGHGAPPGSGILALVSGLYDLSVDPKGSDVTGDGSPSNPFLTLTKAYAFILANPGSLGYVVHLPVGTWNETVGLPPPSTTLRGAGFDKTILRNATGAPQVWAETTPGTRTIIDLDFAGTVTGATGGNLAFQVERAAWAGTAQNVGTLGLFWLHSVPSIVDCLGITIDHPVLPPTTNLTITHAAATTNNGSGSPSAWVRGGAWGNLSYTADDPTAVLICVSGRWQAVTCNNMAVVKMQNSRVLSSLSAVDAGTLIEYDQVLVAGLPTMTGAGSFLTPEILLTRTFAVGTLEADVAIAIPALESGHTVASIQASFDQKGWQANLVSSTASTVTIHVIPPVSPSTVLAHATFTLRTG